MATTNQIGVSRRDNPDSVCNCMYQNTLYYGVSTHKDVDDILATCDYLHQNTIL
jgi:hypothetical protein